jgi:hypothetical protein
MSIKEEAKEVWLLTIALFKCNLDIRFCRRWTQLADYYG